MRTAVLLCVVTLVGACARVGPGSGPGDGAEATPDAGGPAGSDGSGGTIDASGGTIGGGGGDGGTFGMFGGANNCQMCSADGRSVVDCTGSVAQACADNQACQKGVCVDACALAQSSSSAQGCDFYSVIPPAGNPSDNSCFAAMVANTWTAPVTITVEYDGQSLDVAAIARTPNFTGGNVTYDPLPSGRLAPGQMAILFLNGSTGVESLGGHVNCPVMPAVTTMASIAGTGHAWAFRIGTTAPVAAYDIYPFGGAKSAVTSATLLVPTNAWGTNYVATDGYRVDPVLATTGALPAVQIVAAQDDTTVTIDPTVPIAGGAGVAATAAGRAQTYKLSTGQVLQLGQLEELVGSVIGADKPIGVWGGASCMNIPVGTGACDSAHQQLVPVNLLGHEYVAVRYRDRYASVHESVPWTLVGAVDGTTLAYDPAAPAGAPTTVNRGQAFELKAADPFTVTSGDDQHPFYLAGHMTGWNALPDTVDGTGDPETVNTVPPQQWLSSYTFLTDPTYGNTNLVFTRQKTSSSFQDVALDCVGTLANWRPVGSAGLYETTTVDLMVDAKAQGNCANGVHTARSTAPFGLTVWGWDFAVSYAYPAGMGVHPINKVVIPPQ